MSDMVVLVVFVAGIIIAYITHEATHILTARLTTPIDIQLLSWVPLRLQIDYLEEPPPVLVRRLIAIAPSLIGVVIAVAGVVSGLWRWLGQQEPYYLRRLVLLLWILYAHASPADIRSALFPDRGDPDRTV